MTTDRRALPIDESRSDGLRFAVDKRASAQSTGFVGEDSRIAKRLRDSKG